MRNIKTICRNIIDFCMSICLIDKMFLFNIQIHNYTDGRYLFIKITQRNIL